MKTKLSSGVVNVKVNKFSPKLPNLTPPPVREAAIIINVNMVNVSEETHCKIRVLHFLQGNRNRWEGEKNQCDCELVTWIM